MMNRDDTTFLEKDRLFFLFRGKERRVPPLLAGVKRIGPLSPSLIGLDRRYFPFPP